MQKYCAPQLLRGFFLNKTVLASLLITAGLAAAPSHAYNRGMPMPGESSKATQSQEQQAISYYLKYKPEMEAQAKSLVAKLGGTVTDAIPERRILIVQFEHHVVDELNVQRQRYSEVIDYVEVNPQRQLLNGSTSSLKLK
ncbi:hypothetical protein [Photobacterium sp. TY1-4]|uniref:hypothetical protein n=1 Tax=Photobacterium sp. TY1-4 TaxID=2899122 RepID=UPI0021BFEF66|nr:hypothetical protein [Photobacterium sp. TY1-4]UXI02559.1 hypothetical protein NH461_07280 [Photobacterium sp. TY1-4]